MAGLYSKNKYETSPTIILTAKIIIQNTIYISVFSLSLVLFYFIQCEGHILAPIFQTCYHTSEESGGGVRSPLIYNSFWKGLHLFSMGTLQLIITTLYQANNLILIVMVIPGLGRTMDILYELA